MKTEAAAPARAPEAQPRRPQQLGQPPAAAVADLFAALLQAADAKADAHADASPAATADQQPAQQPDSAATTCHSGAPHHNLPSPISVLPHQPHLPHLSAVPTPGTPEAGGASSLTAATEVGTTPAAAPDKAQGKDALNPGAFVSTVAKAQGKTAALQSLPKLLADLARSSHDVLSPSAAPALHSQTPLPAWRLLAPGQAASTLHDALGSADESGLGAATALSTLERSGNGQRDPSGQGREGSRHLTLDAASAAQASSEASAAGADFAQQLDQALQPGLDAVYESINTQISLWAAGQTKKATLLLQDGLRQVLEIELRLDGEQARIDFLTDDAQLREALQAQAQEELGELLERAGLELAGLSIGARTSDQSNGSAQPQAAQAAQRQHEAAATASAEPLPLQTRLPAGSTGLSVYV